MTKAEDIYWGNGRGTTRTDRRRTPVRSKAPVQTKRRTAPWWLSFLLIAGIFAMLCVSINFRAFTEMKEEAEQNSRLASQIQNLMDENLALQEEIHALKSDPAVIQREARRIGIGVKSSQ